MAPKYIVLRCTSDYHKKDIFQLLEQHKKEPLAVVPSLDLFCSCPPSADHKDVGYSRSSNSPPTSDEGIHSVSVSPSTSEFSQDNEGDRPVFTDLSPVTAATDGLDSIRRTSEGLPPVSDYNSSLMSWYDLSLCDPPQDSVSDCAPPSEIKEEEKENLGGERTTPSKNEEKFSSPKPSMSRALASTSAIKDSAQGPRAGKVSMLWKILAEALMDERTNDVVAFEGPIEELGFKILNHRKLSTKLAAFSALSSDKLNKRLYTFLWVACRDDRYLCKQKNGKNVIFRFKRDGWILIEHALAEYGFTLDHFNSKAVKDLTK